MVGCNVQMHSQILTFVFPSLFSITLVTILKGHVFVKLTTAIVQLFLSESFVVFFVFLPKKNELHVNTINWLKL